MRTRRRPVTHLALAALVATCAAISAPTVSAHADTACPACPAPLLFGLASTGMPNSTDAFTATSTALGVRPDVALTFSSFRYAFNRDRLAAVVTAGQLPMITWEPFDATRPDVDTYPLRQIAAGAFDSYLHQQAATVASLGGPVAVRFGHEMNASWYPWGAGRAGTAADYVAAYRHVHDLFAADGATDVRWVWSPAALDSAAAPDLAPFYPGDGYVDWAGLSAYYDSPSDTWANSVLPTLRQLDRVAPSKPVYLAEAAVLPGPTRPSMIHELVGGALASPRTIGLTWFDMPSRFDWRVDADPAAMSALQNELRSGWFPSAGTTGLPAPVVTVASSVAGAAQVGGALHATPARFRAGSAGPVSWLSCASPTDLSGCRTAGTNGTADDLTVPPEELGRYLRTQTGAGNAAGAAVSTSPAAGPVLMTPQPFGTPTVLVADRSARVIFPAPPAGATHWQLAVGGALKQPVQVSAMDYWLTGLVNGQSYPVSLTALAVAPADPATGAPTRTLTGPTATGTLGPMPNLNVPYVQARGTAVLVNLPAVPAGTRSWSLTVGGVATAVPVTTRLLTLTAAATGQPVTWSLSALAGDWAGVAGAVRGAAVRGTVTALAVPAVPAVSAGSGTVTVVLPAAPPGATGWRVTVGATTLPDQSVGTVSVSLGGLPRGYPATWTLRAVAANSASGPVTGRATP